MGTRTLSGDHQAGEEIRTDDPGERKDEREELPEPRSEIDLSDTEIFDILRNSRRRAVLSYLFEKGGRASIKELTEHVASEEYGVAAEEVSADQHKRVYTALYQCHLPRLDEFGVIDFDKDRKEVTLREAASQVKPYLRQRDHTDAARIELIVAVAVASIVTLGVVGIGPLGAVSVFWWTMLTALVLFGIAVFQLYLSDLFPRR
jgi:hypothetical protein